MKRAVELDRLLLKFVLLCQVDIQESSREHNAKFNFLGIILKTPYCRVSKSLKPRILAAMVLPPGYTGFITNLPFRANQRLERMHNVKNVFSFLVYKLIWTAV